jgi:hypothetical protein
MLIFIERAGTHSRIEGRMTPITQAATVAALALGTGAAAVTALNKDIPDLAVPEMPWSQSASLDGLTFYTEDIVAQTGEVLKDELVFRNGGFQSVMCQEYCDFGWTPYQTWTDGEVTHVTVTTRCPDAPHTVVWYARITGDRIAFEGTWTTRRWYWTHQLNVTGQGSTAPPAPEA